MLVILPISLLVIVVAACCVQDIARELLAPRLRPGGNTDGPLVSVIIPARNEAGRIGACLAGLARQTYRSFEVIVVDDDSADGTGDEARGFASRLPALEVVAGAALPDGWAGKCWACWQAAGRARGAWLLFLDADVAPEPELIAALVGRAQAARADAITLMPLLRLGSAAERLLLPAFQSILYALYPLHLASDDRSPIAFANGQCLLVRREVYAALDGHRAVRSSVLEDTDFGQRLKRAGYRLLAATARDLLAVRMYEDWSSAAEGLGKNAVAGYRSGGWRSAWIGLRQSLVAFAPLYVLAGGLTWWASRPGALGAVVALHGGLLLALVLGTQGWLVRRRYRIGAGWAAAYPLGLALYFGLALRALVRVRRGRGVVWKGRRLEGR